MGWYHQSRFGKSETFFGKHPCLELWIEIAGVHISILLMSCLQMDFYLQVLLGCACHDDILEQPG